MVNNTRTIWLDWLNRVLDRVIARAKPEAISRLLRFARNDIFGIRFNMIEPKKEAVMITIIIKRLFGVRTLKPVRVRPELRGRPRGAPLSLRGAKRRSNLKKAIASLISFVRNDIRIASLAMTIVLLLVWCVAPFSAAYAKEFGVVEDLYVGRNTTTPYGGIGRYQNMLTRSEDFTHADWTATSITPTNDQVAPNGEANTACLLTNSATNGNVTQSATASASTAYTLSVWLMAGTSTTAQLELTGNEGDTATTQACTLSATMWQRFSVTDTSGASSTSITAMVKNTGANATTIKVWGAQLEANDKPRVYAKTTTTAVSENYGIVSNNALSLPDLTLSGGAISDALDTNVDISDDLTLSGVLKVNGSGNSYFTGNVGIGITAPAGTLDIATTDNNTEIHFPAGYRADIMSEGLLRVGTIGQTYLYLATNDATRLTIDGSGNVGIGTAEPNKKLDVIAGPDYDGIRVISSTNSWHVGSIIQKYDDADRNGELLLSHNNGDGIRLRAIGDSYFKYGNVGIGDTSPDEVLDVVGNIAVTGTVDSVDIGQLKTDADADWDALSDISLTSANIIVGNAGNLAAAAAMTGDVSITNAGVTTVDTEVIDDRVDALVIDGEAITTTYNDAAGTLSIAAEDASAANKGVATFNSADFAVSSGDVTIKDGGVLRAQLNALRPHTTTPTNTIYVEAGIVTVSDNQAKTFAGGATSAFDPITGSNTRIDLVVIDSTPELSIIKGTQGLPGVAPTYPTDKVVLAEVLIDEITTAVIDASEMTDVRPFLSLGGGTSTATESAYVNVDGDTMTDTLTFSNVGTDITTGANEHLALMPNGTGNVGIGTTGPSALLHLNKAGDAQLLVHSNTDTPTADFKLFVVKTGLTTPNEKFYIDEDGDVGLDGTLSAANINATTQIQVGSSQIDLDDILAGSTNVHLTSTLKTNYDSAVTHITSTGADHSYIDQSVTTTASPTFAGMYSTGNVGIGTTSPNAKLSITGGDDTWSNVVPELQIDAPNFPVIRLNATGGAGKNDAGLEVVNTNRRYRIGINTRDEFYIYDHTAMQDRITVEGDGNVGIGTTAPTQKLDVNGTVNATQINVGGDQIASTDLSDTASISLLGSSIESAEITNDTIVKADFADEDWGDISVATNAVSIDSGLDATKLADGSVSNTEFQYLDGVSSAIQTQLDAKEPTILAGTTAQYRRGDKSWQTLNTTAVSEGTNLYYTNARVNTQLDTAQTIAADWTFSNALTLSTAPSTDSHATTKAYVDSAIAGLSWKEAIIDKDLTTPPGSPSEDNRYLVAASGATDAWLGKEKYYMRYHNSAWVEEAPEAGDAVFAEDEKSAYTYNGTSWVQFTGAAAYTWGTGLSNTDTTVNVGAGTGINVDASDVIHEDYNTSQASVDNSNGIVIQDITLDTAQSPYGLGHVTGVTSIDLDGRYYREDEANTNFVNVSSDTMTGTLTLSPSSGHALVTTAGNVGIGTTNATALLTVGSTGAFQVDDSGVVTGVSFSGNAATATTAEGASPTGTAGGDLIGTYPNPTIGADTVALTTDTTGNYVASVATTSPLSGGQSASEGATPTLSIANAAADGSTKGAATFTANDFNSSTGLISIDYANALAASSSEKGFLTSTDWSTFNNKSTASDTLTGLVQSTTSGASYITGGKLGIGITSPLADLNIKGNPATALTGKVSITAGTANAEGTDTLFLTELAAGDAIKIGDEVRTINTITDDDSLTLSTNHASGALNITAYKDSDLFSVQSGSGISMMTLDKSGDLTVAGTINATVEGTASDAQQLDSMDSTEFAILAGQAGGQTLSGGTDASENLTLDSTTNATKGYVLIAPSGGNVGIDTATPGEKLVVSDTASTTIQVEAINSNTLAKLKLLGKTSGGTVVDWQVISEHTGNMVFYGGLTGSLDTRMVIDTAGNVGIGTTGPGGRLVVSDGTNTDFIVTTGGTVGIGKSNPSSTFALDITGHMNLTGSFTGNEIKAVSNTQAGLYYPYASAGDLLLATYAGNNKSIIFKPNNSEVARITYDGNVGIGTTGPQKILHVYGDTNGLHDMLVQNANAGASAQARIRLVSGALEANNGVVFGITDADGLYGGNAYFWNNDNTAFMFATSSTERMRLGASGGLSLGASYLATDPGAGNMIITGNVGIGTTGPTEKLEISSGNLKVGGTITATGAISGSNISGSTSGTNTGDQTITLTGDVTGSGTGSFAATIAADAVALGTDTTGNYVGDVAAGSGITLTGTPGEAYTETVKLGGSLTDASTSLTHTSTAANDPLVGITLTPNAATDVTQNVLKLSSAVSTSTTDTTVDSLLLLDNADTSTSGTTVVTDAIKIASSGVSGGVVDAIDVSDANITNAINIGQNVVVVNTTSIEYTELELLDGKDAALVDVDDAVATAITGVGTLDSLTVSGAASTDSLTVGGGYNSTGVTIEADGDIFIDGDITQKSGKLYISDETRYKGDFSVANTLEIGVGVDGSDNDHLIIGLDGHISDYDDPVTIADALSQTGSGQVTFSGNVDAQSGMDVTGADLTLDSTNDLVINSDKFTVDGATGNTSVGGTLGVTGTVTLSGALAANGSVTLGDNGDAVAINSSDWDISTAGAMTGIGAITMDGDLTASAGKLNIDKSYSSTAAGSDTYNDHNVTRNLTLDVASGTWAVDGAVLTIDSLNTETSGELVDNSTLLKLKTGANVGNDGYFIDAQNSDGASKFKVTAAGAGTFAGNLSVAGDLNVTGDQIISGTTLYDSAQTIRTDSQSALLVEKSGADGSGADVLIVDTSGTVGLVGINKTPAVGVELDVSGDADVSGTLSSIGNFDVNTDKFTVAAASGNTGIAGTLAVSGNVDANSGLDVAGANLTLDSNNFVINGSKFTVNGSNGNTIMAGTLTHLRSVGLTPDYDNATLRGDGSDNFGTMSLKYGSNHNYYEWTTNEPTAQDYDIVVRYRLPDGFASFDTSIPIKLWNKVSNDQGNTDVTVTMLDTTGAPVTLGSGADLNNTSWISSTITITNPGSYTFDAGGYVTIIIKLTADQGDTVDVGEMTLKGNW